MLQLKSSINTIASALKANAAIANANTVITLCGQSQLKKGLHSLHSMDRFTNSSTYARLLQECIQKKNLLEGRLIHAHMNSNKEFKPDISLLNILINMYVKCGSIEDARPVFDKIPQRNVVSWTTLIASYARDGKVEEALGLFYEMQRAGVKPNEFTFTSIIPACTHLGTLKYIHDEVIRCGLDYHVFVGSSLIDMYAKCGSIEDARDIFDKMPHRNVVSWNTMIAGYAQNGCVEEALELFWEMKERNVVSWTAMISGFMQNGDDAAALEHFRQMQLSGMRANSKTFTTVLMACARLGTLKQGKEIHGFMIRSGDEFDVFAGSALVDVYGKCFDIENARKVFDRISHRDVFIWNTMIAGYAKNGHIEDANELFLKIPKRNVVSWTLMIEGYAQNGLVGQALRLFMKMPERNVVSWNVIIAGFVQNGHSEDALKFFQRMQGSGVEPNSKTFAIVLPACGNLAALEHGKELHEVIIRNALESDDFVNNALLDMYAKCRSIQNARTVFDRLPEGNLVSLNAMIAGYAQNGLADEALKLFQSIPERTMVLWTTMIAGYAQNGHVDDALKLFQKMPEKNLVSWNVMIAGYSQNGYSEEALKLYQQMQLARVKSNSKTFVNVLTGCANLAAFAHGKEIHNDIIKSGFQSDVAVQNALIDMYSKCGCPENARILFERMALTDIASWNAMIAGYAQNGYIDEALELFQKMPARDVVSWTVMIAGYAQKGNLDEALKLFQNMPDHNIVSWNAMIAGYVKNGHIDEALKLFEKMPQRNVVSWTVIIAGYAQSGHGMEALKLFQEMQLMGVQANPQTFAVILPVCANLATLEQGKQIHEVIIRRGFESNVFISSALVDMYAKCGNLVSVCNVFDRMPKRGIVTWNAMIIGYAMHGCGKEALQLFEQMGHTGMKPDHVTFLGILSACCHSGLVNEGCTYFNSMIQYYHITPSMEHYGCMVDLFARAGHLDEAEDFISKMPVQPDATVWGCLLTACRVHKNIELGERVADHIFELDPINATPYVLLSNIYAAAGRWNDIQKVRKIMKDRGVRKNPGCSWIEVNKQVHAFVMGDRSNPQAQKFSLELDRLSGQNPYGSCMVCA